MNLNNKKILLFIPRFKDYEKCIIDKIRSFGGEFFFIVENIDTRILVYRFISKLFPNFRYRLAEYIYELQIRKMTFEPDYILVIRGANLSSVYLQRLKIKFPNSKFIMYQWDSTSLNPNAKQIYTKFDKVLTFDLKDAEKYNWEYRPLFFVEKFIRKQINRKYDLCYISTLVPGRINVFNMLKNECEKSGIKLFAYLVTPLHSYIYHKYILQDKNFIQAIDNIYVRNLPINITHNIYNDTKAIIDYTRPEQNGFTMRTIEAVGHKCKIITNNKNILNADFYDSNNVSIYEGMEINILPKMLKKSYKEISKDVYEYYSLEHWLSDVLE